MPNTRHGNPNKNSNSECLICLNPIRQPWHPGKPCDCKPTLHKRCWEEWVSHGNGVCIICRDFKELHIHQYQIIRYDYQRPEPVNWCVRFNRCMGHVMNFILLFIIVYFLINILVTLTLMSKKDEL